MSSSQDAPVDTGHTAPRWEFDGEVTRVFDDMLRRSIPAYEQMRALCFSVGQRFVQDRTCVVDLGCSRGEAMAPFVERFGAYNRFVGIERSPSMLAAARERYAGYAPTKTVEIFDLDLRYKYPAVSASLTLCILTLQFTPIERRQRIVRSIYEHTVDGGALLLVEKVLGSTAELDELLVAEYHGMKLRAGYSTEDVERKRLALEGVLVPVTAHWNEELLRANGFQHVECFWRHLNFAGWLAVREGGKKTWKDALTASA